ncbi:hypothetical protein H650_07115 [Enterobacter sp. R4-368]|nr:hypothetical protein H650_07115 [Enterobacter sp. R4-368]
MMIASVILVAIEDYGFAFSAMICVLLIILFLNDFLLFFDYLCAFV